MRIQHAVADPMPTSSGRRGPIHSRNLLMTPCIDEFDPPVMHPILMHQLRHLHIETTVARDLHNLALTPPLDRLETLRRLPMPK